MLYSTFDSLKDAHGLDYFTARVCSEIIQNLNPRFELREYQKEAFGRFDFYLNDYKKRQRPAQLLFNMATGSGKTLIMAGNILYLYKLGYRNFIFFVNSTNIIEKTKENFLNTLSAKYLFAPRIKYGEKEVFTREVQNFEAVNRDDINILFTTIQLLHTRLNLPKENAITYEEFESKDIVLISDEAHHLQTLTKSSLNKTEEEEKKSWEYTIIKGILERNPRNLLLEFTATIDLGNANVKEKYEAKIIYQYDLKQFRLDKYSKEIDVLQADLDPVDRAIQAVIMSQYRRKVAEKHKIRLKPVILFKSKSIKESKANYDHFMERLKSLKKKDLKDIANRVKGTILEKEFGYFDNEDISFDNLILELREDFSEEKCMLLDSENVSEEKQLKLNSLESETNEIRAIFAVDMLNEGWDVLNLYDIVRLYDTRDGSWVHGKYKPGNTTMGEAQLIGRGARYYPLPIGVVEERYKRKFDEDLENELRVLEVLHYHSLKNPKYIDEIKATLTEMGIMAEKFIQRELFIKEEFKKTDFWREGIVFLNERSLNPRSEIKSLDDAHIQKNYPYQFRTGEVKEEFIMEEAKKKPAPKEIVQIAKTIKLKELGGNVVRTALDKFEFFAFDNLKKYFPNVKSVSEFISSDAYLGAVEVEVKGTKDKIDSLTCHDKLQLALTVTKTVADQARINTAEFKGDKLFKAHMLKEVFGANNGRKILKFDSDSERAVEFKEFDLGSRNWYAQNAFYGTSEEDNFIKFMDGVVAQLERKYSDIALLRNERFFQIYDFDEGRAFEPDFLMLLKQKSGKIKIYQIFVEPKGNQFKDSEGIYENSKEGWKEKMMLRLDDEADTELKVENKDFKLVGLPFYNEDLKKEFEKAFKDKLLK